MRGEHKTKLPSRLYFLDSGHNMRGPWMNKPTTLMKNHPDWNLITYEMDSNQNYIKQ